LAQKGLLILLDFNGRTNKVHPLPVDAWQRISAVSVTDDTVWVGTADAGLIQFDPKTRRSRVWTVADGLLMDEISCLAADEESLWIGFGRGEGPDLREWSNTRGGLSRLNLKTGKISSFMPSLQSHPASPVPGPPGTRLHRLVAARSQVLLKAVDFHRYDLRANQWSRLEGEGFDPCTAIFVGDLLAVGTRILQCKVTLKPSRETPITATNAFLSKQVSRAELERMARDPAVSPLIVSKSINAFPPKGGLAVSPAFGQSFESFLSAGEIPSPPTALATDGQNLFVAGDNYLANVDLKQRKLTKLFLTAERRVYDLQIAGGKLWALMYRHLYGTPLSALK
jgi:hypothetical protein